MRYNSRTGRHSSGLLRAGGGSRPRCPKCKRQMDYSKKDKAYICSNSFCNYSKIVRVKKRRK